MPKEKRIRYGQIWIADLGEREGSEQAGIRPVLIVQNNKGNKHSNTTIVLCLTSVTDKNLKKLHYRVPDSVGLKRKSIVLVEQQYTIDKSRLIHKVGILGKRQMLFVSVLMAKSVSINVRDIAKLQSMRSRKALNNGMTRKKAYETRSVKRN